MMSSDHQNKKELNETYLNSLDCYQYAYFRTLHGIHNKNQTLEYLFFLQRQENALLVVATDLEAVVLFLTEEDCVLSAAKKCPLAEEERVIILDQAYPEEANGQYHEALGEASGLCSSTVKFFYEWGRFDHAHHDLWGYDL